MDRTLELLQTINSVLAIVVVALFMARLWLRKTRPKHMWRVAGLGFLLVGVAIDSSARHWQGEPGNLGTLVIFAALVFYSLGSFDFDTGRE